MANEKVIHGFHAILGNMRHRRHGIHTLYYDASRVDQRLKQLLQTADQLEIKVIAADNMKLDILSATHRHQGVVAICHAGHSSHCIFEILASLNHPALLLVLDGITDPHNLGACLRVADAAAVDAVIAPRDRAVGITATVERVSCGAATNIPYIRVTNLSRCLRELKNADICIIGTGDAEKTSIYQTDLTSSIALVFGSESYGMRRLTRENCDTLIGLPMLGSVASLNVSVAAGICLYEALRQRQS